MAKTTVNQSPGPALTAVKARAVSRSKITNLQPLGQGQQGQGDRTFSSVPLFSSNPETFTDYRARFTQLVAMYVQSWEARKIVNLVPDDALRKPFILKGIPDEAAKILKKRFDRIQLIPTLKRSLKLERLLGGCLTFLGLDAEEDDPSKPYLPNKEKARLRFINSVPVSRISRMSWDTDPLSEHYMRPSDYTVAGHVLHTSRCLVWDGDPLFDPCDAMLQPYRSNLAGFGPSVLGCLWDDIIAAAGSRQAAFQMVQINGAIIAAVEGLQDITGTAPGQKNLKKVQELINQLSVFRAGIIEGDKVKVDSHAAPFGSVPELLLMYLQVLSAASDIPASRFLGQAPGGLSTDDRGGLENYYNMLDAYQVQRISPQLLRLCDVVGYAEIPIWDQERDLLEIEWPPLWNETAKEQAERAGLTIENVIKLLDASLMGDEQALEEINARGILSVTLDAEDLALLQDARELAGMGGDETDPSNKQPVPGQKEEPVDAQKEIQKLKNMLPTSNRKAAMSHLLKQGFTNVGPLADEFLLGMKDEQEHLREVNHSEAKIAEIVTDHLKDDSQYYSKLRKAGLMNQRMQNSTWDQMKKEYKEVGLLPKGGDNKYIKRKCIKCGKTDDVIIWEGYDHSAPICDHCFAGITNSLPHELPPPHTHMSPPALFQAEELAVHPPRTMETFQGLTVMVETKKGETRKGIGPDNKVWSTVMPADYGELACATGVDGDCVDCYIGPNPDSNQVFMISQLELAGTFDEHKIILGTDSEDEAVKLYCQGFSDGKGFDRLGKITSMDINGLKEWLAGSTHLEE
jgi:phage-related protein (TIGR01555 family)